MPRPRPTRDSLQFPQGLPSIRSAHFVAEFVLYNLRDGGASTGRMMRLRAYLFAEQATIHDVVESRKKQTHQALENLLAEHVLASPPDAITAEFVERFRLSLNRSGSISGISWPREG